MSALNTGLGYCQPSARLLFKPTPIALELGAASDAVIGTLMAVHHANRQGSYDDHIAVALPCMRMGRDGGMLPGFEVEMIASESALNAFLRLEGVAIMKRRGMVEAAEIEEVYAGVGETGAAYVRDRAGEKHTPGWIRRSRARAERRSKEFGLPIEPRTHNRSLAPLRYGDKILHIREQIGEITGGPILVSTYGFSPANFASILPVLPESARRAESAA